MTNVLMPAHRNRPIMKCGCDYNHMCTGGLHLSDYSRFQSSNFWQHVPKTWLHIRKHKSISQGFTGQNSLDSLTIWDIFKNQNPCLISTDCVLISTSSYTYTHKSQHPFGFVMGVAMACGCSTMISFSAATRLYPVLTA